MFNNTFKLCFFIVTIFTSGCASTPIFDLVDNITAPFSRKIIPLEKVTKTINASGGVVRDELGATVIEVPKYAVETDTQFSLTTARDSTGKILTTIEANRYSGPFKIILPAPQLLSQIASTSLYGRDSRR
jgi:hypothetical protein